MNKPALFKYILSMLLFGFNGVVISHISLESDQIVLFRTIFGSLFLLGFFLLRREKLPTKAQWKEVLFVILSGVCMGSSWMFLYEGYRQIGVSFGALLYDFGPVLVILTSPLLFHEKFTLQKTIGFFVVGVGILFLIGEVTFGSWRPFGILCGFLSAATYFGVVTLNKQAKTVNGSANSLIQLVSAFVTVFVFLLFRGKAFPVVPAGEWGWILLLGLGTTGMGCYLYFSSLSKLPAQTVAIFSYLELLSALIFAVIFLQEKITLLQIAGAFCLILGALLCETKPLIKKAKKS